MAGARERGNAIAALCSTAPGLAAGDPVRYLATLFELALGPDGRVRVVRTVVPLAGVGDGTAGVALTAGAPYVAVRCTPEATPFVGNASPAAPAGPAVTSTAPTTAARAATTAPATDRVQAATDGYLALVDLIERLAQGATVSDADIDLVALGTLRTELRSRRDRGNLSDPTSARRDGIVALGDDERLAPAGRVPNATASRIERMRTSGNVAMVVCLIAADSVPVTPDSPRSLPAIVEMVIDRDGRARAQTALTGVAVDLGDRWGVRFSDGDPFVGVTCTPDGVAERLRG